MTIAVLFGGKSCEHDISLLSAANICQAIKNSRVLKIGIKRDGSWLLTNATRAEIISGEWENRSDNEKIYVNLTDKCFETKDGVQEIDVIFPALHGKNGEDGTIQGLLTCLGIPFVGCGVLSSAICMDKVTANRLFASEGIRHVKWLAFSAEDFNNDSTAVVERICDILRFPVFIKPSNSGSSVGVSRCADRSTLITAIKTAFEIDDTVIAEESAAPAMEIEVAVLGSKSLITAPAGRVVSAEDFYTYSSKYANAESFNELPANIPEEAAEKIKKIALRAYRLLGCKGLSRIDFFYTENGTAYINEVNTLPGFTDISMYPQAFAAAGIQYSELVEKLIEDALL